MLSVLIQIWNDNENSDQKLWFLRKGSFRRVELSGFQHIFWIRRVETRLLSVSFFLHQNWEVMNPRWIFWDFIWFRTAFKGTDSIIQICLSLEIGTIITTNSFRMSRHGSVTHFVLVICIFKPFKDQAPSITLMEGFNNSSLKRNFH